jgi:PAS domain-containing protein
MTAKRPQASSLRVIDRDVAARPVSTFCGHCGRAPDASAEEEAQSRVCPRCRMGLLLQAPTDVAPRPEDPFIVIDSTLAVCAVSRQAERLLGVTETQAVNRHVGEFLAPAHAEPAPGENLAAMITASAAGDAVPRTVIVRPNGTYGVRYWARVGPCGPPRAALLVLADAREGDPGQRS